MRAVPLLLARHVPVPAKLRLFWTRVSTSRLTLAYFILAALHCVLQVIFQVQAFSINANAVNFLSSLVAEGNATAEGFYVWENQSLWFCDHVPSTFSTASCELVYNAVKSNSSWSDMAVSSGSISANISSSSPLTALSSISVLVSSSASASSASTSTVITVTSIAPASTATPASTSISSTASSSVSVLVAPTSTPGNNKGFNHGNNESSDDKNNKNNGTSSDQDLQEEHTEDEDAVEDNEDNHHSHKRSGSATRVSVHLHGWGLNTNADLSEACLQSLNWPVQTLEDTKREDVTFIAFQFWVLGMSLVALLNESIPHIFAALVTHLSATAWGAFQIQATASFHSAFQQLSTNGVCQINLLPTYWSARADAEIPSLALNAAVLVLGAVLSWKLVKSFGWQTFKRIGASLTINRIYKLVLTLSIVIQLALFFVVASVALWLDQVCNSAIGQLAKDHMVFKIVLSIVVAFLAPWLIMGWFAVRRELRVPMAFFLVFSFVYVVGWGVMFDSPTFRWTFVQWRFFSAIVSVSMLLILISFVLGIICRMNFGKGLPRYLNAEQPLSGDDYEKSEYVSDAEKISFPSRTQPLPTFSAAFGSGDEVPPPSQMRFGPPGAIGRNMGPRFSDTSSQPFETQSTLGGHSSSGNTRISSSANLSSLSSPAPSYYQDFSTRSISSSSKPPLQPPPSLTRTMSRETTMSARSGSGGSSEDGNSGYGGRGGGQFSARSDESGGTMTTDDSLRRMVSNAGSSRSGSSARDRRWVIE